MEKLKDYCKKEAIPEPIDYCNTVINYINKNIERCNKNNLKDCIIVIFRYIQNIAGTITNPVLFDDSDFLDIKNKLLNSFENLDSILKNKEILTIDKSFKDIIEIVLLEFEIRRKKFKIGDKDFINIFTNSNILNVDNLFDSKFYMNYLYENNLANNLSRKFNTYTDYKREYMEELTLDEILNLVYKLNIELNKLNSEKCELYVMGGFVSLVCNYRDLTTDLDYYIKNSDNDISTIAYDIGAKIGIYGWFSSLNKLSKVCNFPLLKDLLSINGSFVKYLELSNITIYICSDQCLLYSKLLSNRHKDHADIRAIIGKYNLNTERKVFGFIKDYIPLIEKEKEIGKGIMYHNKTIDDIKITIREYL